MSAAPALRIERNEAVAFLLDGERIVCSGSEAMCIAVRDGTLPAYIAKCRAEREAAGIGAERVVRKGRKPSA